MADKLVSVIIPVFNAEAHLPETLSAIIHQDYENLEIIIVNDDGKNAVIVSEEEWDSIQETLYLYSIPGMVESIKAAREEPLSECKIYDPNEEW